MAESLQVHHWTPRQQAFQAVFHTLERFGQYDVIRAWLRRHEHTSNERSERLSDCLHPRQVAAATAREVARPPGVYVPVVFHPPGAEPSDHEFATALLVRVGPVAASESLRFPQDELDAEARRRFEQVTGFRLARRLGLGDASFRSGLRADDLRSAETALLLQALIDLEARLPARAEKDPQLALGERRIVVTGNLGAPEFPEGRNVVVGKVDPATLRAKLADARSVLGEEVLVLVPAANLDGLSDPPDAIGILDVRDLLERVTPGASLRELPPWAVRERAAALGERLLTGRPDRRALDRIETASSALASECRGADAEPGALAAARAVGALVALRRGDVEVAEQRLADYVGPNRPVTIDPSLGAETWSQLESLNCRVLDLRNGFLQGLERATEIRRATRLPPRSSYLLAGTEALLAAHALDEDRAERGEAAEEPAALGEALAILEAYPFRDPASLAYYQGRAAVARQNWEAAERWLASCVRPALCAQPSALILAPAVSCLRPWAMMRRARGQQAQLVDEYGGWRESEDAQDHPAWALALECQVLFAFLELDRRDAAETVAERMRALHGAHPSALHAMLVAVAETGLYCHALLAGDWCNQDADRLSANLSRIRDFHVPSSLIARRARSAIALLRREPPHDALYAELGAVLHAHID